MKRISVNNGNQFARFGIKPHSARTDKTFRGGVRL